MSKKKIAFIILLVLLIAGRLTLPAIVKKQVNSSLKTIPDYVGQVDGVHLGLWRGLISLQDLQIKHKDDDFALTIKDLSIKIMWLHLFHRALVADVSVMGPRIRMLVAKPAKAAGEAVEKAQDVNKDVKAKTGKSLPDALASLMPFRVRNFYLTNGAIRIRQKGQNIDAEAEKDKAGTKKENKGQEKEPGLEARVSDLKIEVHGLTNSKALSQHGDTMARGKASAKIMETGDFNLGIAINPIADRPTFDLDLALTQLNLPSINPVLLWQTGMDVKEGEFDMYMGAKAANGHFKGYVKPFVKHLKMLDSQKDRGKSFVAVAKKAVVGAVAAVLKNKKTETVAARAPFEGSFENPKAGIWESVLTVLRHGFVRALKPQLDPTVHFGSDKKELDTEIDKKVKPEK